VPNGNPSIRRQVYAAVKGLLENINGQAPFTIKVDDVIDGDISSYENIVDNIVLGIFFRAGTIESTRTRLTHGMDCPEAAMVSIRALVRASVDTAFDIKEQLKDDLEIALFQSMNLGILTNALRITSLSFEGESVQPIPSGNSAFATFLATLTVNWLTDPTNP
jgi:hypothetical protein